MGLKERWAPLTDIIGLAKLQDLLLTVLDALDKQDDRIGRLGLEMTQLKGQQREQSTGLSDLRSDVKAGAASQEKAVSDLQSSMGLINERLDSLAREERVGAEAAALLEARLDDIQTMKEDLQAQLKASQAQSQQLKTSMEQLGNSLRHELATVARQAASRSESAPSSPDNKEVHMVKLELIEVLTGLKGVSQRLVSVEERVEALEDQRSHHERRVDEHARASIAAMAPTVKVEAPAPPDRTQELLSSIAQLSKRVQKVEDTCSAQDASLSELHEQAKLSGMTIESLRADLQARIERVAAAVKLQEADLSSLKVTVESDQQQQIDALKKQEEVDIESVMALVEGLRSELLDAIGATCNQHSCATARCLSCSEGRKQAPYPYQLGTDGKAYRKRPSTAGQQEVSSAEQMAPADLSAGPLDLWLRSPGSRLRQQQATVTGTGKAAALKGAHRSLGARLGALKAASSTPTLGLTDAGAQWKATLLTSPEGSEPPLVELDGPDLRIARGVSAGPRMGQPQQPIATVSD